MLGESERQLYQLFTEISVLEQIARATTERALPRGMTLAQFAILNHLVQTGGTHAPIELARHFQISKQSMATTLQRLARAGHVTIETAPDNARARRVALTFQGAAVHQRALTGFGPALAQAVDKAPPGLVERLLPVIAALRAGLER